MAGAVVGWWGGGRRGDSLDVWGDVVNLGAVFVRHDWALQACHKRWREVSTWGAPQGKPVECWPLQKRHHAAVTQDAAAAPLLLPAYLCCSRISSQDHAILGRVECTAQQGHVSDDSSGVGTLGVGPCRTTRKWVLRRPRQWLPCFSLLPLVQKHRAGRCASHLEDDAANRRARGCCQGHLEPGLLEQLIAVHVGKVETPLWALCDGIHGGLVSRQLPLCFEKHTENMQDGVGRRGRGGMMHAVQSQGNALPIESSTGLGAPGRALRLGAASPFVPDR